MVKKVEGHFDELKGKVLKATGHDVKGNLEVIKGKVTNKKADLDIKALKVADRIQKDVEKAKENVRNEINRVLA